ncbi:MAG: hypothetical protein HY033_02185 [Ignavibacteriae bacterium]|nr:hypothetical protein [Ignavibacteria bacterium]MBI3363697.1 hypothetical protein [Ignavibacteriota bacterium]
MTTFKERISIVLSILALGISALSFYVTVLRSAEPDLRVGSRVYIFHDVLGTASIGISVSASNTGARMVVMERFGLLLLRHGSKSGYMFAPYAFQKIDDKGELQDESMACPVAVPGRGEVTKQLLFKASEEEDNFSITSPGTYELILLGWISGRTAPTTGARFEIELGELDANKLSRWRDLQVTNSIVVERLGWNNWRPGVVQNVDSLLPSRQQ